MPLLQFQSTCRTQTSGIEPKSLFFKFITKKSYFCACIVSQPTSQLFSMELNEFVRLSILEDIGSGDHTSLACIPSAATGKAKLLVKGNGILAGISAAKAIFEAIDPMLVVEILLNDGAAIKHGDIAFLVSGSQQSILKAERLVLNVMQRMSGIATFTSLVVAQLQGTKTKVLDTRKTTPLFRFFEKEAVRIGGGTNHRFGLYDMIMLKDNHIDYAGGIKNAIEKTHEYLKKNQLNLKVEIEVRNLDELDQVLAIGNIDRIMLDNFDIEMLKKAVVRVAGRFETEASGGIALQNIKQYAQTGVDFISMGQLTHSIKSLDLSLKAVLD